MGWRWQRRNETRRVVKKDYLEEGAHEQSRNEGNRQVNTSGRKLQARLTAGAKGLRQK